MIALPPAVNPDRDDIADRAKHAFAVGTSLLAEVQYRLAELTGTGRLDRDANDELQGQLLLIWEQLYYGTLSATHDQRTDDYGSGEYDNTYRDGRTVRYKFRVQSVEQSDDSWEHNEYVLGDGAVAEHPRGEICVINAVNPAAPAIIQSAFC